MTSFPRHDELVPAVSGWLKGRRADIAERARQQGWPLSVEVQIPVAEFTTGGMTATTEARPRSLFAAQGAFAHPLLRQTLAKPLIDSPGEDLALRLVAEFGDGLRYLCNYGPGFLLPDLEHPDLLSKTSAPVNASDIFGHMLSWEPLFYALIVLHQCVTTYLSELDSLGEDDNALAVRLATEAITFCSTSDVVVLSRVPLAGLNLDHDAIVIGKCALHRLSRDELGHLFWRRHVARPDLSTVAARGLPGAISSELGLRERVVLEVRDTAPKTTWHVPSTHVQKILLALHLTGVEFAGAGFGAMLREPTMLLEQGQSMWPLLMPHGMLNEESTIGEEELRGATELAARIPDGAVTSPGSPMELAIQRAALAMSRDNARDALVDYTVVLEALFLGGTDVGELRRRFALNGAAFGARDAASRRQLYTDLSDLYSARSQLVHGVDPRRKPARAAFDNAVVLRDRARDIVRVSLCKAISNGWPNDKTFINLLLDDASAEGKA